MISFLKKQGPYLQRFYALLILLSLGFIWGSGYALARYAMLHGVAPLGYAFWQSLGPAVLMSLLVCSTRTSSFVISSSRIKFYFICGLFGIAIPNSNMYFASSHLPAGILAVVVNTVPIITYVLALLFKQETFHFVRIFSVALGVIGLMLLIQWRTNAIVPTDHVFWMLMSLLTPTCFALCALYVAGHAPQETQSATQDAAGMMVFSTMLLLPVVLATHQFYWPEQLLTRVNGVIVLEIFLSSLGYVLLFHLLKIAGAVYYSFVGCVVALTGLFWGWMLFFERLTPTIALAVGLILIALILITISSLSRFAARPLTD